MDALENEDFGYERKERGEKYLGKLSGSMKSFSFLIEKAWGIRTENLGNISSK